MLRVSVYNVGMSTNTETSSTYEQQRDQFEIAIRTLTTVPPTGYDWEAFRDQYVEQVRLTDDSDTPTFDEVWADTLLIARTVLRDWYSKDIWKKEAN